DLSDALAGEVEQRADLFEGDAAAVGDIERTGLGHLPDLKVREVELDGPGLRVHIEVEVILAADPRTRPCRVAAVAAFGRPQVVEALDDRFGLFDLVA